jgi:hypothetical protein
VTVVEAKKVQSKWMKIAKIVGPHVALNVLLFIYLLFGAAVFQSLERDEDRLFLRRKGERILNAYRALIDAHQTIAATCARAEWRDKVCATGVYRTRTHSCSSICTRCRHSTNLCHLHTLTRSTPPPTMYCRSGGL